MTASRPAPSTFALLVRNAVTSYGFRALLALSTLLVTPYLYRRLGAGGFGTWSVVLVLATVYSLLELGFSRGLSKVVAERARPGAERELSDPVGSATVLLGGLGVLAATSAVAVAFFADGLAAPADRHDFQVGMLVLAIERLLYFPLGSWWATLQGYQRYDLTNAIGGANVIAFSVGAVVAVELGYGVLGVTVAFSLAHFAQAFATFAALRRVAPGLSLRPRLGTGDLRRRLWGLSSFVLLAESMTFIGQRMDTLVIAGIRNAAQAAPYAGVLKLQTGLQSLTLPVVYQLMPMASDLWAQGRVAEVRRRLVLATRLCLQATLPVAAALALFSHDVVRLWLGKDAAHVAQEILVVLMIAQIPALGAAPAEQVLVGIGRVRAVGLLALVEGCSNLGLSVVLVTLYGAVGAALGTLATSAVIAPLKIPIAARALDGHMGETVRKAIVPAVVGALPAVAVMVAFRLLLPPGLLRLVLGAGLGLAVAGGAGLAQAGPRRMLSLFRPGGRSEVFPPPEIERLEV